MKKYTTPLLIVWNILLSVLLVRSHLTTSTDIEAGPAGGEVTDVVTTPVMPRDSAALAEARIAFFMVDSLRNSLELLKENKASLATEEARLQARMDKEMGRAQRRSQELMAKDHTYSTKTEVEADELEFRKLESDMRQLAAQSEEQLMRLGEGMAINFSKELQGFLEEYNTKAGFDYIISVEPGGQIWVGNQDLDLTDAVIEGLNSKHRASKGAKK